MEKIMDQTKKNNTVYIAVIVVLSLLLIVGGILYFSERASNQEITQILESEKQSLTTELESLSGEYNNLKTNNNDLNEQLSVEKAKIEQMIEELKKTKSNSYAQIKKYKKQIASLKNLVKNYAFQVDSLNLLSMQLQEENTLYKEEMQKNKAKADSLKSQNEDLEKIVKQASFLEAQNLEVYPANRRNKPVRRLWWTKKLKADFTFPKNAIAKAGTKEIYVIITRPDNVVVGNPLGETFNLNGEETAYTMKRSVYYENETLPVSLFWDNDKTLIKGDYKAEVIVEGKIIGTTNFKIK